jgi:hypothetical protein
LYYWGVVEVCGVRVHDDGFERGVYVEQEEEVSDVVVYALVHDDEFERGVYVEQEEEVSDVVLVDSLQEYEQLV